jgi:hypothetical protein
MILARAPRLLVVALLLLALVPCGVLRSFSPSTQSFIRGDANASGRVDISDAAAILNYLFVGQTALRCESAADTDDNGRLDLADAVRVLRKLFIGDATLPPPANACGRDPSPDWLTCDAFPPCGGAPVPGEVELRLEYEGMVSRAYVESRMAGGGRPSGDGGGAGGIAFDPGFFDPAPPPDEVVVPPWLDDIFPHIEHSPDAIVFQSLYHLERDLVRLTLKPPADGPVTAALPDGSPFIIQSIVTYSGAASVSRDPTRTYMVVDDIAESAPFVVETRAGQEVHVDVLFAPRWDFFDYPAGLKTSTLALSGIDRNSANGDRWAFEVPVSGFFNGLSPDQIRPFVLPERETAVFNSRSVYGYPDPHRVRIAVRIVNPGAPVTGRLWADELPAGVSFEEQTLVTIGRNETYTASLSLRIDHRAGDFYWSPYDSVADFKVRFDAGARSNQASASLRLVEGLHEWTKRDLSFFEMTYSVTYWLDWEGRSFFYVYGDDNGMDDMRVAFDVWVGDLRVLDFIQAWHAGGRFGVSWKSPEPNPALAQRYETLRTLALRVIARFAGNR